MCHRQQESERKKYPISIDKEASALPDMQITSPRPIDKSMQVTPDPRSSKKKLVVTLEEYRV